MVSNFALDIGSSTLSIETGKLAQQAGGSVLIRYGDNALLVTATMSKPREGIDFFPLTIDLEERLYARGKIPGSFFRREGRPSTHSILIARLTDRPIRPLFPHGFRNETQVVITPLSIDQENLFDTLAIIGASAALSISDIPFLGPIAATRVGYVRDEVIVNPTYQQLEQSSLDLVVAGSREGVLMMEAGANEVSEDLVLEAIERAQEVNQQVIALQDEMASSVGKPKADFESRAYPEELDERVAGALNGGLGRAMESSTGKTDQAQRLRELKAGVVSDLEGEYEAGHIAEAFEALQEKEFRSRALESGYRPDGRGLTEVRPISSEVGLVPRTHGTGLFTRGETQILGVATLGSVGDVQKLDTLSPEESKRFLLHYNFPPYSTGEVKRVGSPGRREVGHGALAERALSPVLPSEEDFPYTLRVVCEALSSNGSTSMASVCAGTLALMDAGVPIKAPVAGISIGLVTGDDGRYVTLTDIQGVEDHAGDMDFKVAGSAAGITAIQLDIKVKSIGSDVIKDALSQAREARLYILDRMSETIREARSDLSPYAPRMTRISIPVDKIGAVIGPGGKTIRGITEATGATVDIMDDGTVIIGSSDGAASKKAIETIQNLTKDVKVGEIYTGKVVKTTSFGAFVEILPGKDGMVHISELADYRVPSVEDVVQVGEEITVVVLDVDPTGRVKLSRRALLKGSDQPDAGGPPGGSQPPNDYRRRDDAGERPGQQGGRPSYSRGRPDGDRSGYTPRGPGGGQDRGGPGPGQPSPGPRPPR